MAEAVLIYPYFYQRARDKSIFKFPPLGLGYLASTLLEQGVQVEIIDGTFLEPRVVFDRVKKLRPKILGFYVMVIMEYTALELVQAVREFCHLTVAGGPFPLAAPERFFPTFDLICIGEGEESLLELVQTLAQGKCYEEVPGYAYCSNGEVQYSPLRRRIKNLDKIPFTASATNVVDEIEEVLKYGYDNI